jgi:septum formation protein
MYDGHVLVLASASPARRALLRQAGFAPRAVVSGVDESAYQAASTAELAQQLADAKAQQVGRMVAHDAAVIVGCDSVLEFDGQTLGKPADDAEALTRWKEMRGRSGVLHTGHCLIDTRTGRKASATSSTIVRFGDPDDEELAAYIATGEPLNVAGAFTLDGFAGPFVEGVEGDHGTVIGLSLPLFRKLLGQLGMRVTDFWTPAGDGAEDPGR